MSPFHAVFAAAVILQRLHEAASHRRERGEIVSPGTLGFMALAHALCFAAAPAEALIAGGGAEGGRLAAGLALFLAGFFLRRWVIHTLGRYWSLHIEIRENQPLVTWGPYAWCRHPNYLAILLETAGYCLVFAAPVTAAATLLIYVPAVHTRMVREEETLSHFFGTRYDEYRVRTPRLIPGRPAGERRF